MEPKIEHALREAAREAQALDPDVVTFDVFSDLTAKVTLNGDQVTGAAEAVEEMRRRKPVLFKERDWARIAQEPQEYQRREEAFREGLRTSRRFTVPPKGDVDYGLFSDADFEAADRYLRGSSNDDTVFRRARASQRGNNA